MEKITQKIAELLPKRIVYFAIIRAWAKATTGKYGSELATEIKVEDVIKRWEEKEDKEQDSFFPPENTVREMKVGDTTGFTLGEKHWAIQRDE